MDDENNIYIGRKGIVFIDGVRFPPQDSIFANPYKIGRDGTGEEVIQKYKEHIKIQMKDPNFVAQLKKLKGKVLGCWCKPEGCHGDHLLNILESI
jgi:hypothetical protein